MGINKSQLQSGVRPRKLPAEAALCAPLIWISGFQTVVVRGLFSETLKHRGTSGAPLLRILSQK